MTAVETLLQPLSHLFSSNAPEALAYVRAISFALCCGLLLAGVLLTFLPIRTPYGRYASKGWGPTVPGIVDWVMHGSALLAVNFCVNRNDFGELTNGSALMLTLYCVHYVYRSFVFGFSVKSPKPVPVLVMMLGSGFCFFNSLCIARELTFLSPVATMLSVHFVVGLCLFLFGFLGNAYHDHLLIALRTSSHEEGYKIPHGGLFEYVSGANFFCEICEWIGFALCTGCASAWAFAFCTACNIGPRALHHHESYREMFGAKYPAKRRALIPFVL